MAEAMGQSNATRVIDMGANDHNIYTPAYAIYEHGTLARILLFNYVTDPSGDSDLDITLNLGGLRMGTSGVQVKYLSTEYSFCCVLFDGPSFRYLSAGSTAQKGNITWGGQTFGGLFSSDGRLMGAPNVPTIPCNFSTQICHITVPAPSAALVFLYPLSSSGTPATLLEKTFATTRSTKTKNTVTVDFGVVATSNGENGGNRRFGSTSEGTKKVHSGANAGRIRRRLREAEGVMMLVWVFGLAVSSF